MNRLYRVYSLFLMILMVTGTTYSQVHFVARLSGEQEVPSVTSAAKGTAAFTLTDQGLSYILTVDSIGSITAAHFHFGAIGDTGAVVKTITANFRGNVAVGNWNKTDAQEPLTDEMIASLISGKLYVNVHTSEHPNGEIRGQVAPSSGTSFRTTLSGLEEVPGVISGASGTGTFLLTDVGLVYSITVSNVSNLSGANLQLGPIGVSGDVLRPVTFQNNKAIGIWTKTGTQPLTDRWISALLNDSIYVNVATSGNPNGEIRGQVIQSGGHFFSASLTGSQEIPANASLAKGTGYFTLTKHGLVFAVTVNIGENIIAANLVNAPAGMTGNVVKTLTPLLNGKSIMGVWGFNDQNEPLTKEIIGELLKGNTYINFYTAKYPNGEIRGQLIPSTSASFKALLSSSQVNPPIVGSSKGVGNFVLTSEGLNFSITLETMDTLKTAHFYVGKIGSPVAYNTNYVRSIREFRGNSATGVWKFVDSVDAPLTPQILASLLKDEVFVNIRTKKDTLGGIRGQLIMNGGTSFRALLTGKQEVPKTKSNAYGTGDFLLTDFGLAYKITVDSLVVAASHFHLAPIGQSGGVVKDISSDFSNNSARGFWQVTGNGQNLTPDLIRALLSGKIYVNVHTPNNPNGEIRGQLLVNEGWGFSASLNGTQEVPPNTSTAGGTGAFTFTPSGLTYDITVTGLTPTSFGFFRAPAQQSGSSIKDIFSEFNGGRTVSGAWITRGTDTLTNDNIGGLFSGELYVNAGSATYSSGEIRGQLSETVQGSVLSVKNTNNSIPKTFSLEQNYPNPFNPSTTIKFAVPAFGPVELSVYNILGEKIMTLVNSNLSAGNYEVQFSASNLSSGMYIYRLQAGQNTSVRKMMLLK